MEEIKAGDIMVGNWVNVLPHNKPSQIIEIKSGRPDYKDYVRISSPNLDTKFATEIKNIKGIPLTEDILLKAGFKVSMNKTCYGMITESGKTRLSIFHDGLFKVSCEDLEIKVKHLHQLQNLFKSLTGNDLKIEV